jgi:hypothetical protein
MSSEAQILADDIRALSPHNPPESSGSSTGIVGYFLILFLAGGLGANWHRRDSEIRRGARRSKQRKLFAKIDAGAGSSCADDPPLRRYPFAYLSTGAPDISLYASWDAFLNGRILERSLKSSCATFRRTDILRNVGRTRPMHSSRPIRDPRAEKLAIPDLYPRGSVIARLFPTADFAINARALQAAGE